MITLEVRDFQWFSGPAGDPEDQCAHGRVDFEINGTRFVKPEDGVWTVSACFRITWRFTTQSTEAIVFNRMKISKSQIARIASIIGDGEDFAESRSKFFEHLKPALRLPCDVTGIEDFNWEEFYLLGPGDRREYESLKFRQPSYRDVFELVSIVNNAASPWMMCPFDDLGADVRRKSDGKRFCLGLSEIKAFYKKSEAYQLLHDYSVWFVNWR